MSEFSRVNRPVEEAGAFYSRLAPWYDLLASSEKKFIRAGLELLDLQQDERILEIGFGTGYAQGLIIPLLNDGYSAAVDISPGMSHLAQRKLQKSGIADRSGLVCSDSLPLPFQSNSFDAIFSSFTLELFDTPHIPILLDECRRVLKLKGRLVIVSLSRDHPLGALGKLYEAFHDRFPTIADCRPIPVSHLLEENRFTVSQIFYNKLWGLPVCLASASP